MQNTESAKTNNAIFSYRVGKIGHDWTVCLGNQNDRTKNVHVQHTDNYFGLVSYTRVWQLYSL
jgi:hypothetical protein